MHIESPFSGAVRDLKFIDLDDFQLPITSITDRISNTINKNVFIDIDMLDLENMPNGLGEYRINYERGKGFKTAITITAPHPTGSQMISLLPYKCMLLLAPYSFPKGKYYVIGDIDQPVITDQFTSKTGSKFTDLHTDEMQFETILKNLPPTVSFS